MRQIRLIDRPMQLTLQALNDVAAGAAGRGRVRADSAALLARAFLERSSGAGGFGRAADFHTLLGVAYAIQGRAAEAVQEGERAVALNPAARDATEGPRSVDGLAIIHVLLGHRDEAIRLITQQAHAPVSTTTLVFITPASIRLDPVFDAIRDDPRIQALLKNSAAWVVQ
jgi:serine/threonine-protein kinase